MDSNLQEMIEYETIVAEKKIKFYEIKEKC